MSRSHVRGSRSGMALILVLTVIMALAVIATPFVLSMIMQEKTAVAERARRQAGYGAEGIRNFAVVQIYRNAEPFERKDLEGGKTEATPYVDIPEEFIIEVRDARLKDLKVRDPKGFLWGVTVTDEQGKINVSSAPDRVSVNMRTSLSGRVVDLKDVLTLYSGRIAHWVRPQKIREIGTIVNPLNPTGTKINGVRVDNAIQLGIGAKVRATKPGLAPFEAKVVRNGLHYLGMSAVETDPPIPAKFLNGLLDVEMRHPVNINTARRETLTTLFDGLTLAIPTAGNTSFKVYVIGSDEARKLADGLYRKYVWTWHEFLLLVLNLDADDLAKAAVIINALDPGNLLLTDLNEGRGSMPFCFTSNETVTIEALASVNNEAGTHVSGAGFREVVDLGGPVMLTRSWENQHDFDRMMGPPRLLVSASGAVPTLPLKIQEALSVAGVLGGGYAGYPFGARMETFPKDIDKGEPSDMTLKALQGKDPNYISMRAERDYRGQGGIFRFIEHFDEELEGKKIDLNPHPLVHTKAFAPQPLKADVASGGTEFWIKFDQPPTPASAVKLFDIRENDLCNRISIEVIQNEIVYRITDSTMGSSLMPIDKGWSEIRAEFRPEKDTWYHVAAYWKGTKYGQMLLMVDGFVPKNAKWRHVDAEKDQTMSTELASSMARPDPTFPYSSVPLKDSSFLQKPANWPREEGYTVPLQIGDEVVEFDPSLGEGRRGSRIDDIVYGPKLYDHPADAKVTVFGYTSVFRNLTFSLLYNPPQFDPPGEIQMRFGPLVQTQGTNSMRFGDPQQTSVVGEDTDPDGNMGLSPQNNRIRYTIPDQSTEDNTDWPDMGYVVIDSEVVFYQQITREGAKTGYFEMCQRGLETTIPVWHQSGASIRLWSIAVSTLDNRMTLPTIIQVNQEWFGPVNHPATPPGVPQQFWIGCLVNGKPVSIMRGMSWFTPLPANVRWHEPDEPIVPIFATREADLKVLRTNLGRNDSVTVVNQNYEKEAHLVCHAYTLEWRNQMIYQMNPQIGNPPPPPHGVENQGIQLASLYQPVRNYYPVDGVSCRVIKWPSGELLDNRWMNNTNPTVNYGPAKGKIDEVKNLASLKANFEVNRIAPPDVPQLMTTNPELVDPNVKSGIIVAGEEIIGYAEYNGAGEFIRCKRGWLNSTKQVHNQGDPIFLVHFLPVAAVKDKLISTDSQLFPLTQRLVGDGFNRGYVFVNDEVVGFEEIGVKGDELDCLTRFDGTGLFRGMFGTTAKGHPPHSMVFGMPFRYWDGYKRGQFDNRMPHFALGHTTRDSRWREIRYSIEVGQNDPNLQPHGHVRIDGLGDFTTPSLENHSAVWHFAKAQQNQLQDYISSRLDNGQMETRFFLEYRPGSFWPNQSWKRTMKLSEVRIDYDRDTKVLMHEDK